MLFSLKLFPATSYDTLFGASLFFRIVYICFCFSATKYPTPARIASNADTIARPNPAPRLPVAPPDDSAAKTIAPINMNIPEK